MPQETPVTISPRRYLGQFQKALGDHMAELRNTLRSLEDGSLFKRARVAPTGTGMGLQLDPSGSLGPEAAASACNRCFLNLVRELTTFLDRMIALRRCKREKITLSQPIKSQQDLERLIESWLDDRYQRVARDRSLSNPAKLGEFPGIPDLLKGAAESYFGLRRCLEHHDGVPAEEVRLFTMKLTFLSGDQEITSFPFDAAKGTWISVRADEAVSVLPAGRRVALSETELERIFLTLQQIGPTIVGAL